MQRPNGLECRPQRITSPAPRAFQSPGVIASQVTNRSCSRDGPDRPVSSAASSRLVGALSSRRAWSSRRYWAKRFGLIPTQREKTRWK
jgi:hypothetical protein